MKSVTVFTKETQSVSFIHSIIVFLYAIALGMVPNGFILMLASMSYFYMKENEEKYIFFVGYLIACVSQGMLYTYEQVLFISIWLSSVMLLSLIYHNPMKYTYICSLF